MIAARPSNISLRTNDWIAALLLMLVTFGVFAGVLRAGFVLWDDDILIYRNPHLTGFNAATVKWAFTDLEYVVRYQPLTWLTWAGIAGASGIKPYGFHFANLLFHCLNAALVFVLIRKLLLIHASRSNSTVAVNKVTISAGLAALLWAIHPLRVEPVAWVSSLLHCQAAFFLLLSVVLYLEAASEASWSNCAYWLSVLAYGASLFSYPIGLPFVIVLLMLDTFPLQRFAGGALKRHIWLEKLPFVLLAVLSVAITVWARFHHGPRSWETPWASFGFLERVMQAFYIWAYFLWKPWIPFELSPVYTTLISFNPGAWPFVLSLLTVITVTVLVIVKRRRWPAIWVTLVSYLAILVPLLGLTEHPHFASDRYGYLATLVWSILVAAALQTIWKYQAWRRVAVGFGLFMAVILGLLSVRQVQLWRSSETLFSYTIATLGNHPYSGNLHWRLGLVLTEEGKLDEAEAQFRSALKLMPTFAAAHEGLGAVLESQNKPGPAFEEYMAALRLKPNAQAQASVASLFSKQGKSREAAEHYREALRLKPDWPEILNNLAWLLATDPDDQVRDGTEAVRLAKRACELTRYQAPTMVGTLAAAYAEAGRFDEAIAAAQKASSLATDAGDAHVAAINEKLLALYRQKQPYRDLRLKNE